MIYYTFINRMSKLSRMHSILGTTSRHTCPYYIGDYNGNPLLTKFKFIKDYHFKRYHFSHKPRYTTRTYIKQHQLYHLYWWKVTRLINQG